MTRFTDPRHWLVQLRWLAVAGQFGALVVAGRWLELDLPWVPLLGILFITSFTNHFIASGSRTLFPLIADTILLTILLLFTGGADNPFVCFYLLFIALAAMLASPRGLLLIVLLCAAGFALNSSGLVMPFSGPPSVVRDGHLAPRIHRIGSAVALAATAGFIALFVRSLHLTLVRRESALAEAERRAAHTERFEGLATLAAGIAHEMGTPLGTIAIVSKDLERALERGAQAEPGALEDARLIRAEVDRCTAILKRLDRQSTQGTGATLVDLTTGGLGPVLLPRLGSAIAQRLRIRDLAQDRPVRLPLDAVLQSLVVLIENGCEADPSGQPVVVEVSLEDSAESAPGDRGGETVPSMAKGGRILFRVLDSGRGTTATQRRRAGDPYFTTKPEGSGLGLFLVRTLTQRLGGSIELHPRPEGGTVAVLILPLAPQAAGRHAEP